MNMTLSRVRAHLWMIGLVGLLSFCIMPGHAETITAERAIEVARAHEANFLARVHTAAWTVKGSDGKILNLNDLNSLRFDRDPKVSIRSKVVVEPSTGRFRYDTEGVYPWHRGSGEPLDYMSMKISIVSDGVIERELSHGDAGTKFPPKTTRGDGRISHSNLEKFLASSGHVTGLGWFPPNFWNVRFSTYLQDRHRIGKLNQIESQPDGTWIFTTTPADPRTPKDTSVARLCYDPVRGLVLWEDLTATSAPGVLPDWVGKQCHRHVIVWREFEKDLWVPVRFDFFMLPARKVVRIEYHDLRINQRVDEKAFTIDFPIGTRVVDHVERKSYTVTGGIIDQQKAIQEFMESERLGLEVEELVKKANRSFWDRWRYYIIAGIGLVAVAAAFGGWRWRQSRMLGVLALLTFASISEIARAADPDRDGTWRTPHSTHADRGISQCGFNATIFGLEYFRTPYKVKNVSLALPPSERGICLADIANVLEAHGLALTSRRGLTRTDLVNTLQPGRIAIFPIKVSEHQNHYLVAVSDPKRGALVVDPPLGVSQLSKALTEAQFGAHGGLVLFVERRTAEFTQAIDGLHVSTETIDMGVFDPKNVEVYNSIRKETIELENRSEQALLVSVSPPCGCVKMSWDGGVIGAGKKQSVVISIMPSAWGPGRMQRAVKINTTGAAEKAVTIVATTLPDDRIPEFTVEPRQLDLVLEGNETPKKPVERTVAVTLGPIPVEKLVVLSKSAWLVGKVVPRDKEIADVIVQVDCSRLLEGPLPIEGDLVIGARGTPTESSIRVTVNLKQTLVAVPRILNLQRGATGAVEVVGPAPQPIGPEIADLSLSSPFTLSRDDTKDGRVRIRVVCSPTAKLGVFPVQCRLGSEQGSQVIRFLARVAE